MVPQGRALITFSTFGDMRTGSKLRPGERGTKKLVAQYGDRLVAVRYRYDEERSWRLKTVELIVEEGPWSPTARKMKGATIVEVRVGVGEVELQRKVKRAGGRWNAEKRLWEIRYDRAVELGLKGRMTSPKSLRIYKPKGL